jgi:hypothetical protein
MQVDQFGGTSNENRNYAKVVQQHQPIEASTIQIDGKSKRVDLLPNLCPHARRCGPIDLPCILDILAVSLPCHSS